MASSSSPVSSSQTLPSWIKEASWDLPTLPKEKTIYSAHLPDERYSVSPPPGISAEPKTLYIHVDKLSLDDLQKGCIRVFTQTKLDPYRTDHSSTLGSAERETWEEQDFNFALQLSNLKDRLSDYTALSLTKPDISKKCQDILSEAYASFYKAVHIFAKEATSDATGLSSEYLTQPEALKKALAECVSKREIWSRYQEAVHELEETGDRILAQLVQKKSTGLGGHTCRADLSLKQGQTVLSHCPVFGSDWYDVRAGFDKNKNAMVIDLDKLKLAELKQGVIWVRVKTKLDPQADAHGLGNAMNEKWEIRGFSFASHPEVQKIVQLIRAQEEYESALKEAKLPYALKNFLCDQYEKICAVYKNKYLANLLARRETFAPLRKEEGKKESDEAAGEPSFEECHPKNCVLTRKEFVERLPQTENPMSAFNFAILPLLQNAPSLSPPKKN